MGLSNLNVMLVVTVMFWANVVQSTWTSYEAFEYYNETIEESGGSTVIMSAFMSVAFGSIYATGGSSTGIGCWGSRSCQSLKVLKTDGYQYNQDTRGYLSLAWTKNVTHQDSSGVSQDSACLGEAACYGIDTMTLDGQALFYSSARACNNIGGIYDISDKVHARGTYSMINTTLYTRGDGSTINFYYYGYFAGYNSSIYCNDGDTCNLYCESNACVNLNFICNESVSTCNVYCDNNDYCANNWNGNSDNSDYDIYNSVSLVDDSGELLSLLTKTYNESDWYEDCIEGSQYTCINASSASACYDTSFIDSEGSNIRNPICCSAYQSCYGSTFEVNHVNGDIYCDASDSCDNTQMDLNHQSSIYIRGRFNIRNSIFTNFIKMIVSGSEASYNTGAKVNNGIYVSCLGYQSCCKFTILNVSTIFATGYQSLYLSTIYSNGSDVDIYLIGYKSGYGLTIYCNEGDKCNVYCLNGTNDECLNDVIWARSSNPTTAPSAVPSVPPSKAPSAAPSAAPSTAPTAAPSDDYVEYILLMNVSSESGERGISNNSNRVTFYVRLEGETQDTDWSIMELDTSKLNDNKWKYVNYSVNWTNVGYENSRLTMATYDENDLLFDCFFVILNENEHTYQQSACQTDTSTSVSSEDHDAGYCSYVTIDYFSKTIRSKMSDDKTACPYDNSSGNSGTTSSNGNNTISNVKLISTIVVAIIIGSGILITIAAKKWSKKKAGADEPPMLKIFKFFSHFADFWSDIGITIIWYLNGEKDYFYAVFSSIILLLSTFVSVFGAYKLINKWKYYDNYSKDYPDRLVVYATEYETLIYSLSITGGIKPTMYLLHSKLFYHKSFNLPLKRSELNELHKYQIAMVFVETIPEFGLKIYYLIDNINHVNDFSLLLISLVLTVISVLVEMLVFIGQKRNGNSLSVGAFGQQTILNFAFSIESPYLEKHHIMTNNKLDQCLDMFFKDPSHAWQSKINLCKFSSECYFIRDKLSNQEIEVHCQMILAASADIEKMNEMAENINNCIKNVFDHNGSYHTKLKTAICDKLKISGLTIDSLRVSHLQNILVQIKDMKNSLHVSTLRSISTYDVIINHGNIRKTNRDAEIMTDIIRTPNNKE